MKDETIATLVTLLLAGAGAAIFGLFYERGNYIPKDKDEQVQATYALPSKLEIKLEDLNGDGKKETILKYDNTSYLLKVDSTNMPQVVPYEIKPVEIVPKN